mgnify:CR=1 FL=1|jgi:hypothetical protein
MATREIVSAFASTGLFTAALWLSSSDYAQPRVLPHTGQSLVHHAFASAADVLRETDNNPDIAQQ